MQQPKFFGDIGHVTQRNIVHVTQRSHPFVFVFLAQVGGGVLPEKFGRGVWPASQNPYPIYDQNLRFSLPYLWPDQKFHTLFMTWLLDH